MDGADPDKFVEAISKLEPTFGAINLEDIKAPGCFIIERALSEKIRNAVNNDTNLDGAANLLVMPNLDAANIAVEMIRSVNDVLMIGPILSGAAKSAHIVTPSSTVKGIFNISAVAVADVWRWRNEEERVDQIASD